MQCQFEKTSESRATCVRCGRELDVSKVTDISLLRRECTGKMLLGDWVKYFAELAGFREQCGNCKRRQRKLNRLHQKAKNINAP